MTSEDKRSKRSDRKGVDYDAEPIHIDEDEGFNITLEEATAAEDAAKKRAWYVVHCYSGYESKVKQSLEQRIGNLGMQDKIFDVIVPTEEEIEVKDGKRRMTQKRIFPGYILVDMIHDEQSWFVVRNTPGVTGFVGFEKDPTPLSDEEVKHILDRMNDDRVQFKVNFKINDRVRITSGPFNDFRGRVSHIDPDKGKVRVMVDFFGRETPVELDFTEVDKQ
jgi:transcriptional antiterminator NusG